MSLTSVSRLYARGLAPGEARLRDFQDRRLRAVLTSAAESVPYFRELFRRADVDPAQVRGAEELPMIPVSTKDDLRRWPESERIVAEHRRLIRRMTNGSSGTPFGVLRTPEEEFTLSLLRELAQVRSGALPWDRRATLLESSFAGGRLLPARLAARVGLFRLHRLDPQMPREKLAAHLIGLAPEVVMGYASVVANLALSLAERAPTWRPRVMFTGGETLDDAARTRIDAAFRASVCNLYASAECNLLASDCPQGAKTMHICDEGVVLEVIHKGRPAAVGEAGNVVATALHSSAMPFIRYDTGDQAVRGPQPCPCGWPGTTLLSVEGRVIETFRLPGGRWLHPVSIVAAIAAAEQGWVDEHRLVQEEEDLVAIQLVPLHEPPDRKLDEIYTRASRVLGPEVRLRVELVDRVPAEPGRKRRPFISRVSEQAAGAREPDA